MSDLISRAAAIEAVTNADRNCLGAYGAREAIRALPAASQPEAEPVAWHTEDHLTDKSATTWDKNVAEMWKAKGWPVTPLYTHPTPAPVVPTEGMVQAAAEIRELVKCRCHEAYTSRGMHSPDCNYHYAEPAELLIAAALRAQQPAAPVSGVTVQEAVRVPEIAALLAAAERVIEDFDDMREAFDGLASSGSVTTWEEMDPCGPMDAWMEGERLIRAALSALEGK